MFVLRENLVIIPSKASACNSVRDTITTRVLCYRGHFYCCNCSEIYEEIAMCVFTFLEPGPPFEKPYKSHFLTVVGSKVPPLQKELKKVSSSECPYFQDVALRTEKILPKHSNRGYQITLDVYLNKALCWFSSGLPSPNTERATP